MGVKVFNTDFYPRSPCGERQPSTPGKPTIKGISIHALLAESDASQIAYRLYNKHFYPRSPCGERRPFRVLIIAIIKFLSTLSLRRATTKSDQGANNQTISIHALLAESDAKSNKLAEEKLVFLSTLSLRRATRRSVKLFRQNYISIHALLAESDPLR